MVDWPYDQRQVTPSEFSFFLLNVYISTSVMVAVPEIGPSVPKNFGCCGDSVFCNKDFFLTG